MSVTFYLGLTVSSIALWDGQEFIRILLLVSSKEEELRQEEMIAHPQRLLLGLSHDLIANNLGPCMGCLCPPPISGMCNIGKMMRRWKHGIADFSPGRVSEMI